MSLVDRAGWVTGTNFALCSYEKFQPGFRELHCAVKWNVYDVENTVGNPGRCPPDRQNSSRRSSR